MFPVVCRRHTPFNVGYALTLNGVDERLYVDSWAQAPTDITKHTISFWYKRSATGTAFVLYSTNSQNEYAAYIAFDGTDRLCYRVAGYGTREAITDAAFSDTTSWHHVMCRMDTSRSAGDRLQIWHDGVQQSVQIDDAISSAYLRFFTNNGTNTRHRIGGAWTGGSFAGGLSEFIAVDGQWLGVDQFYVNGYPQNYLLKNGAFGANGFYLDFSNGIHFGADMSGNGNDLTDDGMDSSNQSGDTPTS